MLRRSSTTPRLITQPVAHQGVDAVTRRAEPPELDALAVLDLLGVRVAPLDGDVGVGVGVDEHVEGAVALQLGQEGDAGGDLAEDGGDLGLDLRFGFVGGGRGGGGGGEGVFLVVGCCRGGRGRF